MSVNLWAVAACGVFSMILGSVWYGPLFGKKWMEIIGVTKATKAERDKMMKDSMPFYGIAFVLALFQAWVLGLYIKGWEEASGVENALWIWAAFIIPTLAGAIMWTNEKPKMMKARFMIQAGYQLVLFVAFGLILGMWG